jgi:hypothetical protein
VLGKITTFINPFHFVGKNGHKITTVFGACCFITVSGDGLSDTTHTLYLEVEVTLQSMAWREIHQK